MSEEGDRVITMYSTSWCGYCIRLKSQMQRAGLTFREVNIEHDSVAADFVGSVNDGNHVVPTVVLADGTPLTNPSIKHLLDAIEGN